MHDSKVNIDGFAAAPYVEAEKPPSRIVGAIQSLLVSVILLGSGFGIAYAVDLLYVCLIAFGLQWLVFFLHALPNRSDKLFDLTGGITFISCTAYSFGMAPKITPQSIIVSSFVVLWALRLSSFLFLRIRRAGHDSRFDKIKANALSFFNSWNFQGLWVFFTTLPVFLVNDDPSSAPPSGLTWNEFVGVSLFLIGFSFEIIADRQKTVWNRTNKGKFINTGLWKYSRHPNYFGEIVLWIGIFSASATDFTGYDWFGVLSPVIVTLLLTLVSGIPLVEKASDQKWGSDPEYLAYKSRVNVLIPWPHCSG